MSTTRIAFSFADPGATLDGFTLYDLPQTLPDPNADGWSEFVIAPASVLGRIRRSTMNYLVGDGGYFIRSLQVLVGVETVLSIAIRPPAGLTYAGDIVNLEVVVGALGSNNSFPNAPFAEFTPKYVPPGWELCIRSAGLQFSSNDPPTAFIGSFGFEFDSVRTFEEAAEGMLSGDFPFTVQVANWV